MTSNNVNHLIYFKKVFKQFHHCFQLFVCVSFSMLSVTKLFTHKLLYDEMPSVSCYTFLLFLKPTELKPWTTKDEATTCLTY